MKHALLAIFFVCGFTSCSKDEGSEAYEELKRVTGLTDEELVRPIKNYAEFHRLYEIELEAGTVDPKSIVEIAKAADDYVDRMNEESGGGSARLGDHP